MTERLAVIREHLIALYGESQGQEAFGRLRELLERPHPPPPAPLRSPPGRGAGANVAGEAGTITHRDAILIAYGDQISEPGVAPLRTLADFCSRHLTGLISGIHILPFYPWSSDDGFSVTNYRAVHPGLGTWADIRAMGGFRLMFDAVINHISAQSEWFQRFLQDDPAYRDYFIVVEGDPDLSQVVRPRALPLLTRVTTPSGEKAVWTTFSADQIDLNYRNPDVLLEIIAALLFYAAQGAEFIRLDAVAFLWKEIGTPCIHLPQTHRLVQLLRAVLDEAAPHVLLITETNVPHEQNISYFGDGRNEAQLVYNFALPPLVLHAFRTGSAGTLSDWAKTLTLPSDRTTFFNFLASHDGIGLNPARGILSSAEIDALVRQALDGGGLVSYKQDLDGSRSPYELNLNYFDALSPPRRAEPLDVPVERFMTAQAIMLALVGVPGIYFHSLFGSRGWPEGVRQTGQNRTINRQKLERASLERELGDPGSLRSRIFRRYAQLLRARAQAEAFDPHGEQSVIECGQGVFGVLRRPRGLGTPVLCLHNVSDRPQPVRLHFSQWLGRTSAGGHMRDLITGQRFNLRRRGSIALRPYQSLWLA